MTTATDYSYPTNPDIPSDPTHEIKGLMERVLGQLAESDRRNGDVLRQMQQDLDAMRDAVASNRSSIPAEYRPGFERIENGMALLAHRIAESYVTRDAAPAAPELSQHPAMPASNPANDGTNQHPLKSSVGFVAPPRMGKLSANVDTFDVIESLPGNPAEPWAPDEVAALTEMYDSRDMLFSVHDHEDGAPSQPARPDQAAGIYVPGLAPLGSANCALDRTWLEGRFAEIAARIDQARTVGNADKALSDMSSRFDALDRQMTEALRSLAKVHELGGNDLIQRHIGELSAKLDQVHAELSKFEALENRLVSIEGCVSSDRFAAAIDHGQSANTARSDIELHSIAIAAAEAAAARVAQHAAREQTRAGGTDRFDDVHAMLARFMDERRQGDEQTASVLDTLQQAMVHLLDRVDQQQGYAEPQSPAYAEAHAPSHLDALLPERENFPQPEHFAPVARPIPFDELSTSHRMAEKIAGPNLDPVDLAPPVRAAPLDLVDIEKIADPVARQRAKLQASAQRAALAQREKSAAQQAESPAGRAARTTRGTTAVPKEAGSSARLMVTGLVLAASLAAGAGAVSLFMSNAEPTSVSSISSDQTTGGLTSPTAMGDSSNGGIAPSVLARDTSVKPDPATGILIQAQPMDRSVTPPGRNIVQTGSTSSPVTQISVTPSDAGGLPAPDDDTSRTVLSMPPATVGPNSLRLAASNGDPSAEFEVASRLAEGKGTDQDLALAVRWYQRSASKGFVQAQYRLGTLYERGLGVAKDVARAKSWYQRAAEQGNVKAMHNLAVLAAGRSGAAPDYETGAKWFKAAAGYGLADSQFNLAVLTESGLGVPKDRVQALQWYMIAAQSGDRESIRRRDALRTQVSKTELNAAETFVHDWQAKVPDQLINDANFAGQAWKSRQPGAATADNG